MKLCASGLLLLTFSLTILPVIADNCSVAPLTIPIENVTLSDGVAMNRGIWFRLGIQILGLRFTFLLNNTSPRNKQDCKVYNGSSNTECEGASGSLYSLDSTTWIPMDKEEFRRNTTIVDDRPPSESVQYGSDDTQLAHRLSLGRYPVAVWSSLGSANRSGLGLGPSSSFLQRLQNISAIPSRVLGVWYGSRSQTEPTDGSVIVGGFDRSRVKGPWYNRTIASERLPASCPLQVRIQGVVLNNSRGSFPLWSDKQLTLAACIDPFQNAFTFTPTMYQIWANLTDHPANNSLPGEPLFTSQTYPKGNEHLIGNLTITLDDGFQVIIPHTELVSEERGADEQGRYKVTNTSRIMAAVVNDSTVPMPILGGVFLSQVYLLLDYDRSRISLATAKLSGRNSDIVRVCEADPVGATDSKSLPNRDIALIVVGVVAGLGLVVATVLLWPRVRRFKLADSRSGLGSACPSQPSSQQEQSPTGKSRVELEVSPSSPLGPPPNPRSELGSASPIASPSQLSSQRKQNQKETPGNELDVSPSSPPGPPPNPRSELGSASPSQLSSQREQNQTETSGLS